jgi:hypothetical protein
MFWKSQENSNFQHETKLFFNIQSQRQETSDRNQRQMLV